MLYCFNMNILTSQTKLFFLILSYLMAQCRVALKKLCKRHAAELCGAKDYEGRKTYIFSGNLFFFFFFFFFFCFIHSQFHGHLFSWPEPHPKKSNWKHFILMLKHFNSILGPGSHVAEPIASRWC